MAQEKATFSCTWLVYHVVFLPQHSTAKTSTYLLLYVFYQTSWTFNTLAMNFTDTLRERPVDALPPAGCTVALDT